MMRITISDIDALHSDFGIKTENRYICVYLAFLAFPEVQHITNQKSRKNVSHGKCIRLLNALKWRF